MQQLKDPIVTSLPPGIRVLDGWFQAASTRTAGFAVVNIADLHPAIQVSYLVMMYISVLPIAISVRRTNVYEERSLGIYGKEDDDDPEQTSYVGSHLRRQLSFDLWYIFLGLFIIAIVEGGRLENPNDYVSPRPALPSPHPVYHKHVLPLTAKIATVLLPLRRPLRNRLLLRHSRPLPGLPNNQRLLLRRILHNLKARHHRDADPRPTPRPALRPRQGHIAAQRGPAAQGGAGRGAAHAAPKLDLQRRRHGAWPGTGPARPAATGIHC